MSVHRVASALKRSAAAAAAAAAAGAPGAASLAGIWGSGIDMFPPMRRMRKVCGGRRRWSETFPTGRAKLNHLARLEILLVRC